MVRDLIDFTDIRGIFFSLNCMHACKYARDGIYDDLLMKEGLLLS